MKGDKNDMPMVVLRSALGYLEREAKRRSEGQHAGMMRFQDGELSMLIDLLRREVEKSSAN